MKKVFLFKLPNDQQMEYYTLNNYNNISIEAMKKHIQISINKYIDNNIEELTGMKFLQFYTRNFAHDIEIKKMKFEKMNFEY